MQRHQRQSGARADQQPACQQRRDLALFAIARRLRGQAHGAHPQKTENPVKRRQDDRPQPHRADGCRGPHLPDHAGIDRAEDRHGGVGNDNGNGDLKHAAMGHHIARHQRATLNRAHLCLAERLGFGFKVSHAAAASGNGPWPERKCGCGCPATPQHEQRHSAAPTG